MLSSLKDTLLNVKKNVPLFTNSSSEKKLPVPSLVNLNAGSGILGHFQDDWHSLHATNEVNAKKAEEVSGIITQLTTRLDNDKKNLGLITHILTNSNLVSNIEKCTKQVEELYEGFKIVKEGLLQLENLIEDVEFEKMKKEHRFHLEQYKIRKKEALMKSEEELKTDYDKKVADFKTQKEKQLAERQQVFQEAFKSDLETFKMFGTIPKLDIPKQPSALLEEIQVDYDENELDQFFADAPPSPSTINK